MVPTIHPKADRVQPRIQEGESAHYRDAGCWNKEVSFLQARPPSSSTVDFANLTTLVETEARSRFPNFDQFSKAKREKICQEIAHSAVNRPDIKETASLEAELLRGLGVSSAIEKKLCELLPKGSQFGVPSARQWRDCFLENYHLPPQELQALLESQQADSNAISLLLQFQEKLIKIFTSEQIYLRNNKEFTNKTFLDAFGHPITLSLPIASSKDRSNLHLQNARTLFSSGKFLAVTGRPDTYVKAIEQAQMLIRSCPPPDGKLYYVVNSYINVYLEDNRKMLQNEVDTLKRLEGAQVEVDGKSYTLHPILFNSQLSLKPFEPFALYDVFGTQKSREIQRTNFTPFKALVDRLNTGKNPLIEKALAQLENPTSLRPEEEILLRALICDLLNIPSVHHCASSKDRTTLGLAIAGALRKWISLHTLLGKNPFPGNDPLFLWKNEAFKHLVAQELPGCHQLSRNGLGTRGTIHGKELYDDSVGFKLGSDILSRILPAHYLKEASLPKKALMFLVAVGAWVLCTLIALVRLIIFPIALYRPEAAKEGFLNIFRIHRFASLIPSKELNTQNPHVKDRHLIEKKGAIQPRFLLDLEKSPALLEALIQEMGKKNPAITQKEHREALILIANNWDRFKKLKTSQKLKKLLSLCGKSNLTLFKLRTLYTAEFAREIQNQYPQESIPDSLQRESDSGSIEKDGIYTQIALDATDRAANTITEVIHKNKRVQIRGSQASQIIKQLASFPFAEKGQIPLPIQALLTQTGKSLSDVYLEAFFALSTDNLLLQQRSRPSLWDISLHILDDNTVQAKYRAPFEIKNLQDYNHPPLALLALEFSVTLKKRADGKWTQTSSTLDHVRQQFIDHDELFTTGQMAKPHSVMLQEFRQTRSCNRASRLAKNLLEVLEKNHGRYKPRLIQALQHLHSLDRTVFRKFVQEHKIEVKTTLLGRITDLF